MRFFVIIPTLLILFAVSAGAQGVLVATDPQVQTAHDQEFQAWLNWFQTRRQNVINEALSQGLDFDQIDMKLAPLRREAEERWNEERRERLDEDYNFYSLSYEDVLEVGDLNQDDVVDLSERAMVLSTCDRNSDGRYDPGCVARTPAVVNVPAQPTIVIENSPVIYGSFHHVPYRHYRYDDWDDDWRHNRGHYFGRYHSYDPWDDPVRRHQYWRYRHQFIRDERERREAEEREKSTVHSQPSTEGQPVESQPQAVPSEEGQTVQTAVPQPDKTEQKTTAENEGKGKSWKSRHTHKTSEETKPAKRTIPMEKRLNPREPPKPTIKPADKKKPDKAPKQTEKAKSACQQVNKTTDECAQSK